MLRLESLPVVARVRRPVRVLLVCAAVALAVLVLPWSGRGASAPPAVTTLTVKFSPPSGTHFTTASPPIQVSGCETFYQIEDAIITVNGGGAQYTEQPPGSGNCSTSYSRRFDVTSPPLVPGANTVTANVFNSNGDGKLGSATYFYDAYAISVSGGFDPTVAPGASGNVQFTVTNTGGLTADAELSVACSLTCAIVGNTVRTIASLQDSAVTVQFTAGAVDGAYVVRLAAEYTESPTTADTAEVTVHVRTPVDHVSIAPSSPIQLGVNQDVDLTATVYNAQNVPLAGRSISWSVGNSAIASVPLSSTGPTTTLTGEAVGNTTVTATSEGKNGSANVMVTPSPGPTVSFLPPSNTHFTSPTQPITVRGCHPTLPVTDVAFTWVESLTWNETDASAACGGGFGREFHTTLTLPAHQNVLSVLVSVDNGTASTPASATYFLDQYALAVTPHGGSGPSLLPGDTDTLTFVVRNTGNLLGTIAVAATCPAGFSCSVLGLPSFELSPSDSLSVRVAFTAGGSAGARTLGLTATYQFPGSGSDQGTYTVTVGTPPPVVATVNVVLSGATIAPGAHTTATATLFDAVGAPITGQGVTWSSAAPSVATVTSTGALTGDVAGVATGTAWIRAVAANGVKDSAQISVQTTVTPAVMAASATDLNPGTALDRSLCLTVSLGPAVAAQCGDLRVVHALPAVLERGVRQQPVLLYTTATAHPIQLVAVNVTYTSGDKPDSVQAILRVNGVERRRGMWPGFALQPTIARRLVLGYDVATLATGIQPWTVEVAGYNANTRGTPVTVSGQFVVVNRAQSRFGAGWWLAGLEQLFPQADGSLLWVGGDGSARRYASAGTNVWVPPPLTFPDTITRTGTVYTRHAPGAVQVRFNGAGNHVATVRPVGDSTTFVYGVTGATPQLNSIRTLTGRSYTFTYVSGRLRTVAAPYVDGGVRTTTVQAGSSGQITSITDPDTSVVSFGGLPFFPRVVGSRTDRRGTTTTFAYPVALRVYQATRAMDSVPDIVTRLESAEVKGLFADGVGVLVDTALVYTLIDGPRTDVVDASRIWTDLRYGAPRRIVDAVGINTLLERTNATYPALVTRVERGGLQVQQLVYDARAHVHLAIDVGGLMAGRPDTTRYEWNDTFDAVEQIVPQMKDSTVLTYDATTGNLLSHEDARRDTSRVLFRYYGGTGADRHLLQAIEYPAGPAGTPVDSFTYDAQGNVRETRTPLGFVTSIVRDAVGRDTLVVTPIDSLGHTLLRRQLFDIVDQVRRVATIGSSAIPYTLGVAGVSPDTAAVRNDTLVRMFFYDREGNRTSVNSYTSNAPTDVGTSQSFTYDNANRLLTTDAGSGPWVHRYDAAGNDTAQTYGTGLTVRQAFDAGNRLTRRIVPERRFSRRRCFGFPAGPITEPTGGLGCQVQFPYYPSDSTGGYVIAADTSVFAYDALGRLHLANNRYARITRAYTPSGALLTDSLALGFYNAPTVNEASYVQRITYDRNGRRLTLAWREGPTGYTYTKFGALAEVTDRDGTTYQLAYDAQGRVDSLAITPVGGSVRVWETREYDLDGRLLVRRRVSLDPVVGQVYLDSLTYDQRGNLAAARLRSKGQQTHGVRYAYNPQGAVVAQERTRDLGGYQVEEFRNDAYGNVFYARTRSSAGTNDAPFISGYTPDGALVLRESVVGATPTQNERNVWLEQATQGGAATLTSRLEKEPEANGGDWIEQVASRSYYGADNRLMVVQRYDVFPGTQTTIDLGTWEEYWYDALGRRILTRARRDQLAKPDTSHYLCNAAPACGSYWQRTLWDGAQLLYEWRSPQGVATGMTSGSAGYVYLDALDQPIALLRSEGTRVLNYTARGLAESSVFVDGSSGDCAIFVTGCTRVDWPARTQGAVYFTPNLLASGPSGPYTWFGTLADNGGGSTGMLYRRNRYFDPVSGQFTQQDPIGVGGGMNLWGFANGDPVNYSDPFGLCPEDNRECEALVAAYSITGAGIGFWLGGGGGAALALATGGVATPAAMAAPAALAGLGATVGGLVGEIAFLAKDASREFRGGKQAQRDPDYKRLTKEFQPDRRQRTRIHEEIAKQKKGDNHLDFESLRQIFLDIVGRKP